MEAIKTRQAQEDYSLDNEKGKEVYEILTAVMSNLEGLADSLRNAANQIYRIYYATPDEKEARVLLGIYREILHVIDGIE